MGKVFWIFLEGLLSFFTPCILPLVPLYMAYLSSSIISQDGKTKIYNQKKTFILTLCFIFGIYACFGILSLSINTLTKYISNYRGIISLVGGLLLIIFGLNQIGILKINILNRELRFDYRIENNKVTYLEAFMLGFVFSFAWTPCIGPMLSNAILLSTVSSSQELFGGLYIIIYGVGLTLPFFITGIFTASVIKFIDSHKSITRYISIISGIIVICFGVYMIYTSYIEKPKEDIVNTMESSDYLPANDFDTITGNKVSLYSNKSVVLHYIASWCGYCKDDEIYFEDFCNNHNEMTCYLVMSEAANELKGGSSTREYYDENHPNLDIILDDNLILYNYLYPSAFPYTYITDGLGSVIGVIPGAAFENYEAAYSELLKK